MKTVYDIYVYNVYYIILYNWYKKKKQYNCKKKCFSDCFTNRNCRESIGPYNVYLYLSYNIHFTYTRRSQFMRFMYLCVFYNAVPYNIISAILCLSVKEKKWHEYFFKDLNLVKFFRVSISNLYSRKIRSIFLG